MACIRVLYGVDVNERVVSGGGGFRRKFRRIFNMGEREV